MRIVRFEAAHLDALRLQPAQAYFSAAILAPGYGEMLEREAVAFTGLGATGEVIAIAGIAERWEGNGTAFALVSCDAGRHMRVVVRAIAGFLEQAPWRRIEAAVDVGFDAGERMMRMLGFEREGLARAYTPTGGDCWIYARIKK